MRVMDGEKKKFRSLLGRHAAVLLWSALASPLLVVRDDRTRDLALQRARDVMSCSPLLAGYWLCGMKGTPCRLALLVSCENIACPGLNPLVFPPFSLVHLLPKNI